VRIAKSTSAHLRALEAHTAPAIVVLNHASWWDPLVALMLAQQYCPSRTGCAPMDREMLEKFGFFRKLGIFGVDPDDPRTLPAMRDYVLQHFAQSTKPTLWITPQGKFTDVRAAIALRPGVASIAARAVDVSVVCVAAEYAMWTEKKPELLLRANPVPRPQRSSTVAWHGAMTAAMQENADELAKLVIARAPHAFDTILSSSHGVNPIVNLWARVRGKDAKVVDRMFHVEHSKEASS
jgi:hypothetical protein